MWRICLQCASRSAQTATSHHWDGTLHQNYPNIGITISLAHKVFDDGAWFHGGTVKLFVGNCLLRMGGDGTAFISQLTIPHVAH